MRPVLPVLLLSACSLSADLGQGAKLSLDHYANTDVVGFHLEVGRVSCDAGDSFTPFTLATNVDLLDAVSPGVDFLSDYTDDSRHLGADLFVSLDPGCYSVLAAPASALDGSSWTPSADCTTATGTATVEARETTEITLNSQCVGDPTAALDAQVLVNHPPKILVEIDEKFNFECEPVEVCTQIIDPDDDPIQVTWTNQTGLPLWDLRIVDPVVTGFQDGARVWEACATFVTENPWSYDLTVTVEDMGYASGGLVPLSQVTGAPSSTWLDFPIHTSWSENLLCFDDNGVLDYAPGVSIVQEEGCGWITADEYYCGGTYPIDPDVVAYLCDGPLVIPEALYPECAGTSANDLLDW